MWKENRYRKNSHLEEQWSGLCTRTHSHFYHVGPSEDLRNAMLEALIVKPGYAVRRRGYR
jgi:DNA adenine methylase